MPSGVSISMLAPVTRLLISCSERRARAASAPVVRQTKQRDHNDRFEHWAPQKLVDRSSTYDDRMLRSLERGVWQQKGGGIVASSANLPMLTVAILRRCQALRRVLASCAPSTLSVWPCLRPRVLRGRPSRACNSSSARRRLKMALVYGQRAAWHLQRSADPQGP